MFVMLYLYVLHGNKTYSLSLSSFVAIGQAVLTLSWGQGKLRPASVA